MKICAKINVKKCVLDEMCMGIKYDENTLEVVWSQKHTLRNVWIWRDFGEVTTGFVRFHDKTKWNEYFLRVGKILVCSSS